MRMPCPSRGNCRYPRGRTGVAVPGHTGHSCAASVVSGMAAPSLTQPLSPGTAAASLLRWVYVACGRGSDRCGDLLLQGEGLSRLKGGRKEPGEDFAAAGALASWMEGTRWRSQAVRRFVGRALPAPEASVAGQAIGNALGEPDAERAGQTARASVRPRSPMTHCISRTQMTLNGALEQSAALREPINGILAFTGPSTPQPLYSMVS